jgi:hypothetical protein
MTIEAIRNEYKTNEELNLHSENAVLLAKHFGTSKDLEEAEAILAEHRKNVSISAELYDKRQKLCLKFTHLINKLKK